MKKLFKSLLVVAGALMLGLTSCGREAPVDVKYDSNVKEVVFNIPSIELDVGGTTMLIATVTYVDGVERPVNERWLSSDPNVVSITPTAGTHSAVISAKTFGNAYISYIAGNKSASCYVRVMGGDTPTPPTPPTPGGFTLTLNSAYEKVGLNETTRSLTATPSEPTTITWSSNDESVVKVNNDGLLIPVSVGTTTVTATAPAFGVSASCTVEISTSGRDFDCEVYFYIDYNNVDEKDKTGTKLLAYFEWYSDLPLTQSGQTPRNPTTALDPAFPYFIGWSSHPIIDQKSDLWDMENDVPGNYPVLVLYGIWAEVTQGEFIL